MTTNAESLPGLGGQLTNFVAATIERGREVRLEEQLHGKKKIEQRVTLSGPIFRGLLTLLPDEVHASFAENPESRVLTQELLEFQYYFNEQLDFVGGKDRQNDVQKEKIKQTVIDPAVERRGEVLFQHLDRFPEHRRVVEDFVVETAMVEEEMKKRYNTGYFSLPQAIEYKTLVNAIYINTVVATALGPNRLSSRLDHIPDKQLTYERVLEKYRWMMEGDPRHPTTPSNPRTKIERALLIMLNVAMAAQVDDDWYGRKVDDRLGIPSLASAIVEYDKSTPYQEQDARRELKQLKRAYKERANHFGLSKLGTNFPLVVQELGQKKMHKFLIEQREKNIQRVKQGQEPIEVKTIPFFKGNLELAPRDAAFASLQI